MVMVADDLLMYIDMTNLTAATATVLAALRYAKEAILTDANGTVWGMVYIDNGRSNDMSRHKFAGHLSDLKSAGLYRPTYDGAFGEVKLEG
jgi:hypothetical protein